MGQAPSTCEVQKGLEEAPGVVAAVQWTGPAPNLESSALLRKAGGGGSLAAAAEKARAEFEKAESALMSALGVDKEMKKQTIENDKPQMPDGIKEAMQSNPDSGTASAPTEAPQEEEHQEEEKDEEEEPQHDEVREWRKAQACLLFVICFWSATYLFVYMRSTSFVAPRCDEILAREKDQGLIVKREACEPCGSGTHFAPFFREYEQSWPKGFRAPLYFIGLLWVFQGIDVVCGQFMGAIEEITSTTRDVWVSMHEGSKHKFRIKVWNGTVANLTLMALGSSAPEILLNVVEITGGSFFAGELGPSTIVGSAAFNLLMIISVCVSAIPAPDVRRVEQTTVFAWTSSMSLFAYFWMVFILRFSTPDKVDLVEAVITLFCFPLLVFVAYLADKGYCECGLRRGKSVMTRGETWEDTETAKIVAKFGKALPDETIKFLLKQQDQEQKPQRVSKFAIRQQGIQNVIKKSANKMNDNLIMYGFAPAEYVVLECDGTVTVKFAASDQHTHVVELSYKTVEGTAKADARFRHKEGQIRFTPGQMERSVDIEIIDNDTWEPDEEFTVEITDIQVITPGGGSEPCIGTASATVTVLNDDIPGTFDFDSDEIYTSEGQMATLGVTRASGSSGKVSVHYRTISGSAIEDRDYVGAEGYLEFEDGEMHKELQIEILTQDSHFFEEDEKFKVMLDDVSPGAKFNKDTDGGEEAAYCDVIIAANKQLPLLVRCGRHLFNMDKFKEDMSNWAEQFTGAMYCNGSAEDQFTAEASDWFFHASSMVWKLLFSLIPPPSFCGGWVCFWSALCMIGLITAFVGDIANLLGCSVGLSGDITAITLVALGTSLPDTFASKMAAEQEDTADDSVGNVMGSNSVNVFLGLGLPWTIAAVYWNKAGVTQEWLDALDSKGVTFADRFLDKYPAGGFMVPAESLAFSVIVFASCALVCMALLIFRRYKYGGELGGPIYAQYRDSAILASLWFVYIAASIAYSLNAK